MLRVQTALWVLDLNKCAGDIKTISLSSDLHCFHPHSEASDNLKQRLNSRIPSFNQYNAAQDAFAVRRLATTDDWLRLCLQRLVHLLQWRWNPLLYLQIEKGDRDMPMLRRPGHCPQMLHSFSRLLEALQVFCRPRKLHFVFFMV